MFKEDIHVEEKVIYSDYIKIKNASLLSLDLIMEIVKLLIYEDVNFEYDKEYDFFIINDTDKELYNQILNITNKNNQ